MNEIMSITHRLSTKQKQYSLQLAWLYDRVVLDWSLGSAQTYLDTVISTSFLLFSA